MGKIDWIKHNLDTVNGALEKETSDREYD